MGYRYISIVKIILCALVGLGCIRDQEYILPHVSVDETLWLNNPSNIDLQIIGGIKTIDAGIKGIIIYRSSKDVFFAYEQSCPHIYPKRCSKMIINQDSFIAKCDCDNSTFWLLTGEPLTGNPTVGLKKYEVSYNSQYQTLHIYN
ncbi:Rieske (2Fe-2S) protein [Ichthyobacterium seriolicida]|uniref:Rieske (2Fe-2S) protein n=1 Tax=Ichthyobacterium seriolicida TaxID=242600 RepID=UPI000BBCE55D|nr:hypothetical protein [Ichthyobacterium seriolicida]